MVKKTILMFFVFTYSTFTFSWPFEQINSWVPDYNSRSILPDIDSLPDILKELPTLQTKIPHVSLGNFPAPVRKLGKLGEAIGSDRLYFKDDGPCAPYFGGNKVRKLEFLLADALYSDAGSIMAIGDAGSNCVLAALAQAKRVGFSDVYCLLGPQLNTSYLRRNLLMDLFHNGIIKYYESEQDQEDAIWQHSSSLQDAGKPPYIVTWGGTCPIGFLGYMNAAFELKKQIEDGLLPEPDYIYVPLGSTGTAGGLIIGAQLAGLKSVIIPVAISGKNGDAYFRTEKLAERINEAIDFFTNLDPNFPAQKVSASDIEYRQNFANYRYAEVRELEATALQELFDHENIKLEGTYTGKALTAMLSDIKNNQHLQGKTILFWNTFCYGTFEDVTNSVDYKDLPEGLHRYFETDIQSFDSGL